MLAALLIATALVDCVPARWFSADPGSLELLENHPVNCLVLDPELWRPEFSTRAHERQLVLLGRIRPGERALAEVDQAQRAGLDGVIFEGRFATDERQRLAGRARELGLSTVFLGPRLEMDLSGQQPVIGTYQALWPGINVAEDGSAKAAPTGAPWIDSNQGFLRYVRARVDSVVWLAFRPPRNQLIPLARYLQAIHDCAPFHAWWVIELDEEFQSRLLGRKASAVEDWKRMGDHLRFWVEHRDWFTYRVSGQFGIIHDAENGALMSGGILDMLASRHVPVKVLPLARLSSESLAGLRMLLNVDPQALKPEQREAIRAFTRSGGTLLSAPAGWSLASNDPEQFLVSQKDVEILDSVWRGVNSIIGRENLGVRLFNVATMRALLLAAPEGRPVVLHLVNYADYPVEHVTCRFSESFSRATVLAPGRPPEPAEIHAAQDGTEVIVNQVQALATLVLE